jgi:hypothetical protein
LIRVLQRVETQRIISEDAGDSYEPVAKPLNQ